MMDIPPKHARLIEYLEANKPWPGGDDHMINPEVSTITFDWCITNPVKRNDTGKYIINENHRKAGDLLTELIGRFNVDAMKNDEVVFHSICVTDRLSSTGGKVVAAHYTANYGSLSLIFPESATISQVIAHYLTLREEAIKRLQQQKA